MSPAAQTLRTSVPTGQGPKPWGVTVAFSNSDSPVAALCRSVAKASLPTRSRHRLVSFDGWPRTITAGQAVGAPAQILRWLRPRYGPIKMTSQASSRILSSKPRCSHSLVMHRLPCQRESGGLSPSVEILGCYESPAQPTFLPARTNCASRASYLSWEQCPKSSCQKWCSRLHHFSLVPAQSFRAWHSPLRVHPVHTASKSQPSSRS